MALCHEEKEGDEEEKWDGLGGRKRGETEKEEGGDEEEGGWVRWIGKAMKGKEEGRRTKREGRALEGEMEGGGLMRKR